jgi:hypothetical protein
LEISLDDAQLWLMEVDGAMCNFYKFTGPKKLFLKAFFE